MFGLLPIEGSWCRRFEKLFKEFFLKPHPFFIRIFRTSLSILRKSPRPSLPLKRAPPLTPTLSPSGEREETALLGARNRYALRLADHQRSRQIVCRLAHQRRYQVIRQIVCRLAHQRRYQVIRQIVCRLAHQRRYQVIRQIVCRLAHSMFLSRRCRYNGCRSTMTR